MSAMKPTEDPKDVLRLLGRAQAREGLEARVMARVAAERREENQQRGGWLRFWSAASSRQSIFAVAAVAVALLVVGAMTVRWIAPHRKPAEVAIAPTPTPVPAQIGQPPIVPGVVAPAEAPHVSQRTHPAAVAVSLVNTPRKKPALPTMPLTHQEQLMLEFLAAQKRSATPNFRGVLLTERVENHGLGKNAIAELSHSPFQPMSYNSPGEKE